MIFLKKVFFSEQVVTFRSVFGPQLKNLCLCGKIVSPVLLELHFTCPVEHVERKVTIGKKCWFFVLLVRSFFFFFGITFHRVRKTVLTNWDQHSWSKEKKNWDLWFERIFLTLVRTFGQGRQTCILHVQGTILRKILFWKVLKLHWFLQTEGKFRGFPTMFSLKWLSEMFFACPVDCFEKKVHNLKSSRF